MLTSGNVAGHEKKVQCCFTSVGSPAKQWIEMSLDWGLDADPQEPLVVQTQLSDGSDWQTPRRLSIWIMIAHKHANSKNVGENLFNSNLLGLSWRRKSKWTWLVVSDLLKIPWLFWKFTSAHEVKISVNGQLLERIFWHYFWNIRYSTSREKIFIKASGCGWCTQVPSRRRMIVVSVLLQ